MNSTPSGRTAHEARQSVQPEDSETRERLLVAATRLFADSGFARVTIRDICQAARANVAAVNYHFDGKVGLYTAVMRAAIQTMQGTTEEARSTGDGKPPEEQLRIYVRVFITRVVGGPPSPGSGAPGGDTWIHQLMMREMSDPTPALDMVIEQVIRPRLAYLCGIVSQIMACANDDPRVFPCAFSINAQCLALLNHRGAARVNPAFAMTPAGIEAMVNHITEFSLAGLWAAARTA
ncbi:MAG: CerR family C-terminal domain-containing protein [Vicinamibacterales bacterium]